MAILENGADPHGKSLPAGVALAQAGTAGLPLKAPDPRRVRVTAMRAKRTGWPKVRLDKGEGGFLIVKMRDGKNGLRHGQKLLMAIILTLAHGVVKCSVAMDRNASGAQNEINL
jgi:hypothetical protein